MEFNLADLFECVADQVPGREGVVAGDRRLTYAELDERSSRLAHGLESLGISARDHVGIYMYNCAEFLEAMLACYKIRAVPVNVNYRYVDDELAHVFADADLVCVVHHRELGGRVEAVRRKISRPEVSVAVEDGTRATERSRSEVYEDLLASASPERSFPRRSADDEYLLYTGGTTGLPKGVLWRQEDIFFATLGGGNPGGPPINRPEDIAESVLANRAQRIGPFLQPGDDGPVEFVSLALGPLMHASGQWSALSTLLGGGRVVLYTHRQMDMAKVLELVERERVSMLTLVGDTSARPLLEELDRRGYDTSSLLLLGSGGSLLSGGVKDRLLARLPTVLAISEAVGSSEAPVQAVAVARRRGEPSESLKFDSRDQTMVVDEDLRPVPAGSGVVGRLATRGHVPLGYYKDPVRTERTFVDIDGVKWSLPGDMAEVEADGTIRLVGRGSLCINTGGEKVYPDEVEAVLKTHPLVADVLVVGAADPRWGERVVAVVEPVSVDDPPTIDSLREHCRGRLAGYKAPRSLQLVDQVQRSPAGKPDYGWATRLAAGPA